METRPCPTSRTTLNQQQKPTLRTRAMPLDSDSDSDSDSEDEAKQNMELQTLEYQLSNEPSNYDTYVQ
ncbi:hypothetical protein AB3S75_016078 [Citrus x aurantiifolia]